MYEVLCYRVEGMKHSSQTTQYVLRRSQRSHLESTMHSTDSDSNFVYYKDTTEAITVHPQTATLFADVRNADAMV